MLNPSPQTLQLNDADTLGSVTIDVTHFESFADDFDQRLQELVDAWKHLASPNATRIHRTLIQPQDGAQSS